MHSCIVSLPAGALNRAGSRDQALSLSLWLRSQFGAQFFPYLLPYSMDHGPVAMHCPNTILNLCTEDEPIMSPPLQVVLHVYTSTLDYSYTVPPVRTGLYTVALAPAVTGSVFMLRFRLLSAQCAVISNGKCGF